MIGIYCRISVDRGESTSIEHQKSIGIEFAKQKGWNYKVYIDRNISGGAKQEDRPAFNTLINDIENSKLQSIYIWNNDRAAREESTWFGLVNTIVENKVTLYENGQLIDFNDDSVRDMQGIKAIFAASFRRNTSKKIKKRLDKNVQDGKVIGWNLPYGYTKDENKYLVVCLEEKDIIKEVFKRISEGGTITSVRNWLNESNIPTRYNKIGGKDIYNHKGREEVRVKDRSKILWRGEVIKQIIQNPIYKGKRRWKGSLIDCPNIVTPILWQQANDTYISRKSERQRSRGKNTEHIYLLTPLLQCGCKASLVGRKNGKQMYYACSNHRYKNTECKSGYFPIEFLEYVVTYDVFKSFFKEAKEVFSTGNNKRSLELQNKISNKNDELLKVEPKQKRLNTLVVDGVLSSEEFSEQRYRLQELKNSLEGEIEVLKGMFSIYLGNNNVIEDIEALEITPLVKEFGEGKEGVLWGLNASNVVAFKEKRNIIHRYVKNILVEWLKDEHVIVITISYKLPIPNKKYYCDDKYYMVRNESFYLVNNDANKFRSLGEKRINEQVKYLCSYIDQLKVSY